MGLSTKKTTTDTKQNTSMTTTPNNPTYVSEGIEGLAGQIKSVFGGIDPSKVVAGADPLQSQAAGAAAGLGNFTGYGPMLRKAPGMGGGGMAGVMDRIKAAQANYDPSQFGNVDPNAPIDPSVYQMAGGGGSDVLAGGSGGDTLGGGPDPFIDSMNIARGVAGAGPNLAGTSTGTAASLLQNLGDYQNRYVKDVKDTSLADFDYGADRQRGQAQLDLANDTTFGGSGGALFKSALEGELARGRGALSAGLSADAFDKAAQLSLADAGLRQQTMLANQDALNTGARFNAGQRDGSLDRRLNASGAVAGLAAGRDANTRANAGTQYDIGSGQRDIQNQQNRAPIDLLMQQIAAFSGLPLDAVRGSTTTGTMDGTTKGKTSGAALGDWLELAGKAAAAAAMASDVNLKTDIETERYDGKGRRWVSWRWVWDEPEAERQHGVIAQEVQETDPEAVMRHPLGFLMVDYSKLQGD